MGFNYDICGFDSVGEFVDAMKESEGRQLDAFIAFVIENALDDDLRHHDWAGFAYGYNGADYKINQYDKKLAAAYKKYAASPIDCDSVPAASKKDDSTPAPPAVETTSQSSATSAPQIPAVPPPATQNADTIVNTGDTAPPSPPPTDVTIAAPQGMGSVSSATKVTIAGITVPPILVGIVGSVQDAISKGYVDAKQIGDTVINLITNNTKYILLLCGGVVGVIIVKKICRELIFMVTVISHAVPWLNNVTVTAPEQKPAERYWWQIWKWSKL